MNEENPSAEERLQIAREVMGSDVQFLKQGDPLLSSVAISFYPMPLKSEEKAPPKKVRRKITKKTKPPA